MQIAASRRYAVRLQESVVLILEAAELLSTAPGKDAEERASLVYRIREIERRDRDLAHSLTNDLNHAPLEPPDIKLLGDLIRDLSGILRSIAAASSKFALYQIPEPLPFMDLISETIFYQTGEVLAALMAMRNDGQPLDHCAEIKRLGHELEQLQESSLNSLFDSAADPIELIKRKEIIDSLVGVKEKIRNCALLIESAVPGNECGDIRIAR
jgi:uncharacterized protein Yka (UPF0111/DUF47 family)